MKLILVTKLSLSVFKLKSRKNQILFCFLNTSPFTEFLKQEDEFAL